MTTKTKKNHVAKKELQEKPTEVDYTGLINQIDQNIQTKIKSFQFVIYILVTLVILLQIGVVWFLYSNWKTSNDPNTGLIAQNTGIAAQTLSPDFEVKTITNFSQNSALSDFGSNLIVDPNFISIKNIKSCDTPIVPPPENGCGFSILPSALSFSEPGILLKSIRFKTSLGDGEKIDLSIKNFEKGTIGNSIATIKADTLALKTPILTQISPVESIYVRFWLKTTKPKIEQIVLEYASYNKLKVVKGQIQNLKVADKKGLIWSDVDENGIFNKKIDRQWVCTTNFPGVKEVNIDGDTNFALTRDDSCYKGPRAEDWGSDNGSHGLPAGKWLLVADDQVFPFEINQDQESFDLVLK
jgi:hypothetical protein